MCTSWGTYVDQRWPLKAGQESFQPNPDYVAKRPTITPTKFEPLWWTSPTPDYVISRQRRYHILGITQNNSLRSDNDWIYDPALVGKPILLYMKGSTARRPKPVPCYTMWHAGYIKPVLVRQGSGKHITVDQFTPYRPNPAAKVIQQPWLIIGGSSFFRGRYCKAVQFFPGENVYTVQLLVCTGGRFSDAHITGYKIRVEELNVAWVDPRFKEEVEGLKVYVPQRQQVDLWSVEVDLPVDF
jgi:hypothetical protein